MLLTVEGKRVRAIIDTRAQETRIGQGVLAYLQNKRPLNISKKVLRSNYGIETLQAVSITLNLVGGRDHTVECYIDPRVRKNEMVIGLHAMINLGYRITVAGSESRRRKQIEQSNSQHYEKEFKPREDDEISFLDEDEGQRIREWMD